MQAMHLAHPPQFWKEKIELKKRIRRKYTTY
jgi:hypothetical protein